MKILMIGPDIDLVPGGMSSVVKNYLKSSLSKKVDIKYISTNIEDIFFKKICWAIKGFIEYIKNISSCDIVHIHMAERGSFYRKSLFILIGKLYRKKILVHFHGAEFDKFYHEECGKVRKKYINYILNLVDVNIALGEEWKAKIQKYTKTKVVILNNAVYTKSTKLYNNENKYITLLGRLEERKGTFDLLDIADDIIEFDNEIKIILAGDGNLQKVNKIISTKKYKENIELLGWIDKEKRDEILKDSLIFTLPSYNEGMPMAILEAMSFGIPLVVSNVGGIPTVVEDNINGYLITPGDKEVLKLSILKLLKDKERREIISKNNYDKIIKHFNLNKNIETLYNIYSELV